MSLVLILALPFFGSIIAAFMPSNARNIEAWLAGIVALASAGITAMHFPAIFDGEVVRYSAQWLPAYDINFTLRMDGFAWLFAMIITVMGALIALYARYYMSPADPVPRYFSFFLAFMGSMLG